MNGAADVGPMERLRVVCADPMTMSVIVQRVADGEMLKEIAKSWQVPYARLMEWLIEDEERAAKYARARAFAVSAEADDMKRLADSVTPETVGVVKVQAQITQWRASKLDRPTFGDRQDVKVQVEDNRVPLDRDAAMLETARSLAFIMASGMRVQRERDEIPKLSAPIDVTPERAEAPVPAQAQEDKSAGII